MSELGPPVAGGADRAGTAYVVEVEVPGEPVRRLPLRGTVEFGRRVDGVVLADAEASRRHFRLIGSGGAVLVEDLGSTNGTRIGGVPVAGTRQLVVGDVVSAGRSRVRLVEVGPVVASVPAAAPAPEQEPGSAVVAPPPAPGPAAPPPPPAAGPPAAPPAPPPAPVASASPPPPPAEPPGGVAVAGTPLVLHPVDQVERLARVEVLTRAAAEAWAGLGGLGLAGAAAAMPAIAVGLEASATGAGVVADPAGRALTWRIPADQPPDPLLPGLAVVVATVASGRAVALVALGLALDACGVADPAPGLARRGLPARETATGPLRVAMARSFAGYLLARCGRDAVTAFVGAGSPADASERDRAHLGHELGVLDREWRDLLAGIPPSGPLRGPLLRRLDGGGVPDTTAQALVEVAVGVLGLAAADGPAPDALRARATEARVPAGGTADEGRWLAVVTRGHGELVARTGPFAGTVVAEVGPGDRYGVASVAGRPRGLTLRAVEDLDLLVVDDTTLTDLGVVGAEEGTTRPGTGSVEEIAVTDVLLADLDRMD